MAETNFEIISADNLLEKINQEIEILEEIYCDEGIVIQKPTLIKNDQYNKNNHQEFSKDEKEFVQTSNLVRLVLDIKPQTGMESAKIGLLVNFRFDFNQFYPFNSPKISLIAKKGLDEEQFDEIVKKSTQESFQMVTQKRSDNDNEGFLFALHEKIREIITNYNDTVKGRCAVCLFKFKKSENSEEDDENEEELEKFTDRHDLVRIDHCFHRFHLICLHRDWFMPRVTEKDSFGGNVHHEIPEIKKCPICRREVQEMEIEYVKTQYLEHPELEDDGYKQAWKSKN